MDAHTAARIERMRGYQDAARRRMHAASQAGSDASARFAGGQPILVGHHSEPSARAARRRSDQALDRYVKESGKFEYWGRRIAAAERRAAQENDPGVIQRRIARLEAEQRRIVRLRAEAENEGDTRYVDRLDARAAEVAEQLAANRAQLAESGAKVWGRADFARGDYVLRDGMWWEIKSANQKTVTVAAVVGFTAARARLDGRRVYRLADNPYDWTDTVPYTEITGRMSAAEMAARFEA